MNPSAHRFLNGGSLISRSCEDRRERRLHDHHHGPKMTEPLERAKFIEVLKRLGSDQDEAVLEAARQAYAQITVAGITWEDLLVPDVAAGDTDLSAAGILITSQCPIRSRGTTAPRLQTVCRRTAAGREDE